MTRRRSGQVRPYRASAWFLGILAFLSVSAAYLLRGCDRTYEEWLEDIARTVRENEAEMIEIVRRHRAGLHFDDLVDRVETRDFSPRYPCTDSDGDVYFVIRSYGFGSDLGIVYVGDVGERAPGTDRKVRGDFTKIVGDWYFYND